MELRGHHLLCIHGFQGMGYNDSFVKTMTVITEKFRNEKSDFPVKVKATLDDACSACPHNGGTVCQATPQSEQHVVSMDYRVLQQIGLTPDHIYLKSELIRKTIATVKPEDLDVLCAGCSWLSYGVCKQGIQDLLQTQD